ncbi:MAG: heavy metal-binding domain-containing protein [Candidatus Thermoplasmatota archaeon]|nr:heavy metal-binding domain-containing protein [Candidatus Thermoplasmatota archaeon]
MSARVKRPSGKSVEGIILTTSDDIHGTEVLRYLGLAFGHRRVEGDTKGKSFIRDGPNSWPWAENPEHYEALFRLVEGDLKHTAMSMGADAVIGCSVMMDRDNDGRVGITLTGTAVSLARSDPVHVEARSKASREEKAHSDIEGGDVRIAFAGMSKEWKPLSAVQRPTPRRGGEIPHRYERPPMTELAVGLANDLGVSQGTALSLIKAGMTSPGDVASTSPAELARICKMNPTQARLLLQRAAQISGGEDA